MIDAVVTVNGVTHVFGEGAQRREALVDVSFELKPGEIAMLTGPSGAGKTTLLTLVGGLRSLQHGCIRTLGVEIGDAASSDIVRLRRRIGFILQFHNLLPALTVEQNVRLAVEVDDGWTEDESFGRAGAALAAVGMEDYAYAYPQRLSGGQRQRVAIARALVREPNLVLADEPTAALDKHTGREIVELLQRLSGERGCAILLVTHDSRILDVAHRILTLEDGRLQLAETGRSRHDPLVTA
jgi:putative ABC transport system ATP-binding protein